MSATAADAMSRPVVSVSPGTGLAEIAALLARHHISAVPVCDGNGVLVGIVGQGDVLKPFSESAAARRDWWIGMLAEGEPLAEGFLDYIGRGHRKAADVMVRDVITADETTPLSRLAELMVRHRVKSVPVLRDGCVTGMVSKTDLVAAIARSPALLAQ